MAENCAEVMINKAQVVNYFTNSGGSILTCIPNISYSNYLNACCAKDDGSYMPYDIT